MASHMDGNISTHLKVLYICVFGLYFGFLVLLYCNYSIWWKAETITARYHNENSPSSAVISTDQNRVKRNRMSERSINSNSNRNVVEECAILTNICQEKYKGIPGPKGDKGDAGADGNKGEYGISGMTGPMGPPGPPGEAGRDGAKGDKGEQGHPGLLGFPGYKGEPGYLGEKGDKGDRGIIGPMGPKGTTGSKGETGSPGKDGIPGKRGKQGKDGPPGEKGTAGQPGLDGFKGDKGERGDTGNGCSCPRGEKGDKGQRGLIGFTGYKGDKGDPGQKGNEGFGLRGQTGIPGKPGMKGDPGEKGSKGDCIVSSPIAMESWIINSDSPSPTVLSDPPVSMNTEETITTIETTSKSTPKPTPVLSTTSPRPSLPPRKIDLKIEMTGIPLFLRQAGPTIGCLMKDSVFPNNYYVTYDYYGQYVYQFSSTESFTSAQIDQTHNLRHFHFYGNSHMVFNGSLYYHTSGDNTVVRFDFDLGDIDAFVRIHGASFNDSNYLYKGSHMYFDIEIDENGLWVIYRKPGKNSTYITKIDPVHMNAVKTWQIDVNSNEYGNGFIAGGNLYLIQDSFAAKTTIAFAYDLYEEVPFNVTHGEFNNPFRYNTMMNYFPQSNPRMSRLLAWDNGVQMEYPFLFKGF